MVASEEGLYSLELESYEWMRLLSLDALFTSGFEVYLC